MEAEQTQGKSILNMPEQERHAEIDSLAQSLASELGLHYRRKVEWERIEPDPRNPNDIKPCWVISSMIGNSEILGLGFRMLERHDKLMPILDLEEAIEQERKLRATVRHRNSLAIAQSYLIKYSEFHGLNPPQIKTDFKSDCSGANISKKKY